MLSCCRVCVYRRTFKTSSVFQTYKSVYNLENLYPNSPYNYGGVSQDFSESQKEKFSGIIPIDKLTVKYSRSSGPGGQHVNKTNTKAEVRFHVKSADWIPEDLKPKILAQYKKRVSGSGELIVSSDESRYQLKNMNLCLEKIRKIIEEVEKPPDTRKQELMEELLDMDKVHAAHRKRLQRKRMKGFTKAMRSGADFD